MKKLLLFIFAAVGLASCLEPIEQTILVSSVVVAPENISLRVGQKSGENGHPEMTATVLPGNATDKTVVWASSRPAEVAVDKNTGKITALAMGSSTVTITATVGGKTGQCLVTVVPTPAESITITGGAPATFAVGETFVLTATVSPSDTTDKSINWSVGAGGFVGFVNATGATVQSISSADGKVTVKALKFSGDNDIHIRATSNSDSRVYKEYNSTKVTATPVSSVSVKEVNAVANPQALKKGDTFQLKADVMPANATNQEVSWVSSNNTVATIDATGKVTVVGIGPVTFTATVKNENPIQTGKSIEYNAVAVPATAVVINEGNQPLAVGGTFNFTATLTPANSTDVVVWTSSAPTVATINNTGLATGLGNGTASITATAGGVSGTAVLTIGTGISTP